MSTYEDIFGKRVKFFDEDPTLDSTYEGQVWYNSTTGVLKSVVSSGAWSSSLDIPQAITGNRMAGTQTAGVSAFGKLTPAVTGFAAEYNGSGWSTTGTGNTARAYMAGFGIQTAAYFSGGYNGTALNNSESYNGSTFSNGPTIGTARWYVGGAGTSTAGLIYLGTTPGSTVANTEEWNGSSWSEVNDNPTARRTGNGFGTQTAAVAAGGMPNTTTTSQEYDGTNWTSGGTLNTGRAYMAGWGTQTAGLVAAGNASGSVSNATERYDGTSFSTTANLAVARNDAGGAGATQNSGVLAGGYAGATTTNVEEYNFGATTITAAAFSSGPNLNNGREGLLGGAGTNTSAIAFGGYKSTAYQSLSEGYDGSSWSNLPTMNTARASMASIGSTQTAAIAAGGYGGVPQASFGAAAESYNGSSWTSISGVTPREQLEGCGTQTAGLICGGLDQPGGAGNDTGKTEEWNGSAWSEQNDLNTARGQTTVGGSQTAAICAGGQVGYPDTKQSAAEEYNGTSWTNVTSLPTARRGMGSALTAPQTATIFMGGDSSPGPNFTYDGTSWSTTSNLARSNTTNLGSAGVSQATAMVFGGSPYTNATELFNAETETVTAKTLTTG